MTRDERWSRRRLVGVAIGTTGLLGGPAAAQGFEPSDRGIGGTGVAPSGESDKGDRGIGGTGVVGTIRRFGSIVVNGLRITFPRTVAVEIDGRPARLSDLRVGHVVHVLAESDASQLFTRRIETFSTVIGPIEKVTGKGLVVMGQTISVPHALRLTRLRPGRWVAVSGLRRLDGTVVASLVAHHRGPIARIAGIPTREAGGQTRIGALPLDNLPREAIGQRMRISGRLVKGRLVVEDARPQWSNLMAERPARMSIEDYVAVYDGTLAAASGLAGTEAAAEVASERETRAILSAAVSETGQIHVDGVNLDAGRDVGRSENERESAPTFRDKAPATAHPGTAPSLTDHGSAPGPGPGTTPMSGVATRNPVSPSTPGITKTTPGAGSNGRPGGSGHGGGHGGRR